MIEPIGKQPYKLKLFQTMKIYNVFHVLLLKLCDRTHKGNVPLPSSINVESEDKYKIKEILISKSHYSKLQYFVKGISYSHSKNQWLSEDNVVKSKNLIELFYKLYLKKPKVGKEKKTAK